MRISHFSTLLVLGMSVYGTACTQPDSDRSRSEITSLTLQKEALNRDLTEANGRNSTLSKEVQDLKVENKDLTEELEIAKAALSKLKEDKLSEA